MEINSRDAAIVYRRLASILRAEVERVEGIYDNDLDFLERISALKVEAQKLQDMANQLWEAKPVLRG